VVGRQRELARMRAAYDQAADGAASAVLLGGEAGVGKTRLLGELTAHAHAAGALVLVGRCADLRDADMPLLPIAEALAALGPLPGGASAGLEEAWTGRAPGVAVFMPILELLREAAESAPVVFAVDDVHWADRSTLDLLTFVLGRLRDERLMLMLSFRDDELERRADLRDFVAEAGRQALVTRIELARLTREELRAQLEGILGRVPEPALVESVFSRSAGNPLFAEELVAATDAGAELPATLRDMLLARMRSLDEPAQAAVRAAAVGGGRVHHDLLAEAVEHRALDAAIREAIRGHVLVAEGDAVAFRHPLLQEVAYDEALPGERAALHAAFARALEGRPDLAGGNAAIVAAEVAHHWWRAGDRPRALRAALDAAIQAERAAAPAEAAVHLLRALDLWDAGPPPQADRAEVLARAAEAVALSGSPERAVELVTAALDLIDEREDPVRAGLLHERRGYHLWWQGRGEAGVADYEEAVRLVPAHPPSRERAFVLAGLGFICMVIGPIERSRAACEEALAVARSVGAGAAEVRALATLGNVRETLGDRPGGIAALREARALAREVGDPEVLCQTAIGLSDALRKDGQLDEAVAVGLEGAEDADRAGVGAAHGAFSALNAAEAAFELGRWDVVERVTADVLARPGGNVNEAFAHYQQGVLSNARGDVVAAEEHARLQRELLAPAAGRELSRYVLELEADVALSQRAPEDAARAAGEAVRMGEPMSDPLTAARPSLLGARAEADGADLARARHDPNAEEAAIERAEAILASPRTQSMDNPAVLATIEAEVLRARGSSDPDAWAVAARACEARGAAWQGAYAWWRSAEAAMARSQQRAVAAAALARARPVAERLGARPLLEEIDGLARRARLDLGAPAAAAARERVSPPEAVVAAPPDAAGPMLPEAAREVGLTARELEVLEHIALGQTNRQIAAELFISARTAGVHVSHILEKLGASTRTEAATAAHRLGLVP
jgi:DNA-binding CsgD family transcriptional regulator/tetratricopeptide (TPR) repeat protein